MRIRTAKVIFSLFVGVILISSCDSRRLYDRSIELEGNIWNKDTILSFDVPVSDSISSYDVIFDISHNSDYNWQNFIFFLEVTSPANDILLDTVDFDLSNNKGEWYGDKIAGIYRYKFDYLDNVRMPVPGLYRFEVRQAMRVPDLQNIQSFGLRVQKSKGGTK